MKEMCKYIKCDIAFEKRLISMPIKYCFFVLLLSFLVRDKESAKAQLILPISAFLILGMRLCNTFTFHCIAPSSSFLVESE